jgi:hypothetical protein
MTTAPLPLSVAGADAAPVLEYRAPGEKLTGLHVERTGGGLTINSHPPRMVVAVRRAVVTAITWGTGATLLFWPPILLIELRSVSAAATAVAVVVLASLPTNAVMGILAMLAFRATVAIDVTAETVVVTVRGFRLYYRDTFLRDEIVGLHSSHFGLRIDRRGRRSGDWIPLGIREEREEVRRLLRAELNLDGAASADVAADDNAPSPRPVLAYEPAEVEGLRVDRSAGHLTILLPPSTLSADAKDAVPWVAMALLYPAVIVVVVILLVWAFAGVWPVPLLTGLGVLCVGSYVVVYPLVVATGRVFNHTQSVEVLPESVRLSTGGAMGFTLEWPRSRIVAVDRTMLLGIRLGLRDARPGWIGFGNRRQQLRICELLTEELNLAEPTA